jgi:transcriptional regulator with XRE-family HTH domain
MAVMRRGKGVRRSRLQVAADIASENLNKRLGRGLRDARTQRRRTQTQASAIAGISRSEWSGLELGSRDATVWVWNRAAAAVGTTLNAYLPQASAADQPRDAVHLKGQELILRTSKAGGWQGLPEERFDPDARTSRFADVYLERRRSPTEPDEVALMEVINWFDDVGTPMRAWQRRLDGVERYAIAHIVDEDKPLPRISGCWVVRATKRNRALVAEHSNLFATRFPGSGRAWVSALTDADTSMPVAPALLWISVKGDRLFPARLG